MQNHFIRLKYFYSLAPDMTVANVTALMIGVSAYATFVTPCIVNAITAAFIAAPFFI